MAVLKRSSLIVSFIFLACLSVAASKEQCLTCHHDGCPRTGMCYKLCTYGCPPGYDVLDFNNQRICDPVTYGTTAASTTKPTTTTTTTTTTTATTTTTTTTAATTTTTTTAAKVVPQAGRRRKRNSPARKLLQLSETETDPPIMEAMSTSAPMYICWKCPLAGCQTCSEDNFGVCDTCSNAYRKDVNGTGCVAEEHSGGDDDDSSAVIGGVVGTIAAVALVIAIVIVVVIIRRRKLQLSLGELNGGVAHSKLQETDLVTTEHLEVENLGIAPLPPPCAGGKAQSSGMTSEGNSHTNYDTPGLAKDAAQDYMPFETKYSGDSVYQNTAAQPGYDSLGPQKNESLDYQALSSRGSVDNVYQNTISSTAKAGSRDAKDVPAYSEDIYCNDAPPPAVTSARDLPANLAKTNYAGSESNISEDVYQNEGAFDLVYENQRY